MAHFKEIEMVFLCVTLLLFIIIVYNYCLLFFRWYVVSDMTKSRSAAGVALLDNEIFVVGGHDGLQIFNSVRIK